MIIINNTMENQAHRLYALLKEIVECCQEREAIQAKHYGLTIAESRCLTAVKLDHCRTTTDLAEKLFVAKSRITRIVDGLVEKGLVNRGEDASDRRIRLVHLTAKGSEVTDKLIVFMYFLHNQVLEALPASYRHETIAALGALKEAMNSVRIRLRNGEITMAELLPEISEKVG